VPRISAFYGIVIAMYFDEHPPPHFHARYGEFDA
jgi:phosphomannomutase